MYWSFILEEGRKNSKAHKGKKEHDGCWDRNPYVVSVALAADGTSAVGTSRGTEGKALLKA